MRIPRNQGPQQYERIIESVRQEGHRILVQTSYSVDGLCACQMQQESFRINEIPYRVNIVETSIDIKNIIQQHIDITLPLSIILLDCGNNININTLLNINEDGYINNLYIYIIDSHRPINLYNLENKQHQVRVQFTEMDDIIDIPENISIEQLEKIENNNEEISKNIETKIKLLEKYYNTHYIIGSTSFTVLDMLYLSRYHTNSMIWYGIIGTTYNYIFEKITDAMYETLYLKLRSLVIEFNNDINYNNNDDDTITIDDEYKQNSIILSKKPFRKKYGIYENKEFIFPLLQFWTLYDALSYTRQSVACQKLWKDNGEREQKRLFAKMAIPLKDARSKYETLNIFLRDKFTQFITILGSTIGLHTIQYNSFRIYLSTHKSLSAGDVAYSLHSLLHNNNYSNKNIQDLQEIFWNTLDCNSNLVKYYNEFLYGVENAKQLQIHCINLSITCIRKKQIIRHKKLFSCTFDQLIDTNTGIFSNISNIRLLGLSILSILLSDTKKPLLPLLLAIRSNDQYLITLVSLSTYTNNLINILQDTIDGIGLSVSFDPCSAHIPYSFLPDLLRTLGGSVSVQKSDAIQEFAVQPSY